MRALQSLFSITSFSIYFLIITLLVITETAYAEKPSKLDPSWQTIQCIGQMHDGTVMHFLVDLNTAAVNLNGNVYKINWVSNNSEYIATESLKHSDGSKTHLGFMMKPDISHVCIIDDKTKKVIKPTMITLSCQKIA